MRNIKTYENFQSDGIDYILKRFGDNHTDPIVVSFGDTWGTSYGVYTYQGEVFCINEGMDFPFEDNDIELQKKIVVKITTEDFEINPSFQ